jgi:hypothetical protein
MKQRNNNGFRLYSILNNLTLMTRIHEKAGLWARVILSDRKLQNPQKQQSDDDSALVFRN